MAPAWNMTTKTYLGDIYILWMLNKTRPSQLEKTEGNLIYFQRKKIKHQGQVVIDVWDGILFFMKLFYKGMYLKKKRKKNGNTLQ